MLYLGAKQNISIELPSSWLWDIIDEFIYQFQSFCQFIPKLKNKSNDDFNQLKNNLQVIFY